MNGIEVSITIHSIRRQIHFREAVGSVNDCPPYGLDRDLAYELIEMIKSKIDDYFEHQKLIGDPVKDNVI